MEIPKRSDWNNREHRLLYFKLFYESHKKLTPEENRFCTTMYHYEEFACGLDGDR